MLHFQNVQVIWISNDQVKNSKLESKSQADIAALKNYIFICQKIKASRWDAISAWSEILKA